MCMDDPNASAADNARIQIWHCNGGSTQTWAITPDHTYRIAGKCLTAAGTANGASVRLDTCTTGNTYQQWRTGTENNVVNAASGKCLDDTGFKTANGTKLEIWTCTGKTNQQWTAAVPWLGRSLVSRGSGRLLPGRSR